MGRASIPRLHPTITTAPTVNDVTRHKMAAFLCEISATSPNFFDRELESLCVCQVSVPETVSVCLGVNRGPEV